MAVLEFVMSRVRLSFEALGRLPGRQRFRYLHQRMTVLAESVVQRDLLRGNRPVFYGLIVSRANLLAYRRYEPRAYPGPVVLFCAEEREIKDRDERLAWRRLATEGLEVYSVPGADSGLMLVEPHVRVLAEQLRVCLERAQGPLHAS